MTESAPLKFAVLGAGSWGTAVAALLAENQYPTLLWGRNVELMQAMAETRRNTPYLGEHRALPASLQYSADLNAALTFANTLIIATPCRAFEALLADCRTAIKQHKKLIWLCKGLRPSDGALFSTLVREAFSDEIDMAVISGPNFAKEVIQKMPTATTVAANNAQFAATIAQSLHNTWFRAYSIEDMISAQIGGALKNVYAIATGVCDGMGLGANARAALITRAMTEIMRLGKIMGGQTETFMGMTGIGDLILTCTDNQSRNRRFGLLLAEGLQTAAAEKQIGQAVEGVGTTKTAFALAQTHQVDMPILAQVYQLVENTLTPQQAVTNLLSRDAKHE